eukprot:g4155.t1
MKLPFLCVLLAARVTGSTSPPRVRAAGGAIVQEGVPFVPQVEYDSAWYPVCGQEGYLWSNNHAANTICTAMGFGAGFVHDLYKLLDADAMPVGGCWAGEPLNACTGGGNDWGRPGSTEKCRAAKPGGFTVRCQLCPKPDEYGTPATCAACPGGKHAPVAGSSVCVREAGACPFDGSQWMQTNGAAPASISRAIDGLGKDGQQSWRGGAMAENGAIYAVPFDRDQVNVGVLKVLPYDGALFNDTAVTLDFDHGSSILFRRMWYGTVLSAAGTIFGIPYSAGAIMRVDPETDEVTKFGSGMPGTDKWRGGVLATNGAIYGIPAKSAKVLKIWPREMRDSQSDVIYLLESDRLAEVAGQNSEDDKYADGALAPDGYIFAAPHHSGNVLRINPFRDTMHFFGWEPLDPGGAKWDGLVLAGNGNLYACPYSAKTILKINPRTNSLTLFGGTGADTAKWAGGALAPNGRIFCAPYNADTVLKINPLEDAGAKLTSTGNILSTGGSKWLGAILSTIGDMYAIPGWYSNVLSATDSDSSETCVQCFKGQYNDQEGRSHCKKCSTGRYQDQRGQDIGCKECSAGRFANATAFKVKCAACPAGKYQDADGQPFCLSCGPGYFGDANKQKTDVGACVECPNGKFQPAVAKAQCIACKAGEFQDQRTSASCKECRLGQWSAVGAVRCTMCDAGKFGSSVDVRSSVDHCVNCPAGEFQSYPGKTFCVACGDNALACVPCEKGKYQHGRGKTFCNAKAQCIPGQYVANASALDESRCAACAAGSYSNVSNTLRATPAAVAVGHYTMPRGSAHARNRTGQARCEEGFFCRRGERFKCPPGRLCTFQSTTTVATSTGAESGGALGGGVQSEVVRITGEELCPEGQFAFNGTACIRCPVEGVKCNDGRIELLDGFWYDAQRHGALANFWHWREAERELRKGFQLYRCPQAGQCLAQPREEGTAGDKWPTCKAHHGGPLCSVCEDGFYKAGHVEGCRACPKSGTTVLSIFMFVLVLGTLYRISVRLWRRTRERYPDLDLQRLSYEMPQIIKLTTGMYQIVGSFQSSFHAVQWPESYNTVVSFMSAIFSFDFFGQPVFACASVGDTFSERFMWHTFSVLSIVLALLALMAHAETRGLKKRRTALWNILLPFLFVVYPSVSKTTILMLRCQTIDGGSYLLADYKVRCDDGSYPAFRALGIVFTFLYPIGIPVLFAALLANNRRKLPPDWWPFSLDAQEDRAFTEHRATRGQEWTERADWREQVWKPQVTKWQKMETRFGFLFNAYTNRFYWFESLVSIYKLAMTTLVVFVAGVDTHGGTRLKILYSMFMATCLIALVAFFQPFKDADVLSVETMVNLELLFVLFAALYLQEVPGAAGNVWVGLLLIMLLLVPMLAVVALLSRSVREELRMGSLSGGRAPAHPQRDERTPAAREALRKGARAGGATTSKAIHRFDTKFDIQNPLS